MAEDRRRLDGEMERDLAGNRSADRLGEIWNEIVTAGPTASGPATGGVELDRALAETVRRLTARDDAPPPPPGLADRTWQELMRQHGFTGAALAPPAPLHGPNGLHDRQSDPNTPAHTHPRTFRPAPRPWLPRFRRAIGRWATAAMLLLTLGSVLLAFGVLRQHDDRSVFDGSPLFRGGPDRTGEQPGPGPDGPPGERWRVVTEGRTAPTPVLADGVLYFGGDDGVLWAVDAASGDERWRFAAAAPIGAPPAVGGDAVYVGDRAGTLYALDRETGTSLWQLNVLTAAPQPPASPSPATREWTYALSAVEIDGVVIVAGGQGPTAPAAAGGLVFVPASSISFLRAVDAATGAPLWRFPASENTVLSSLAGVHAIDALTGEERWFAGTNGPISSTPAVVDGVVYFGSQRGAVSAVDIATGSTTWVTLVESSTTQRHSANAVSSSPAVVDGVVYAGSLPGNLYALDAATGEERWQVAIGQIRYSSPVVADGVVYVVADGVFHAVDAETGADLWQVDLGNGVDASAVVAGGLVFVGMKTDDGQAAVVALE